MPYINTIPGFFRREDMYLLELENKKPAGEVLGLFKIHSKVEDVYLSVVITGGEEADYLHTKPRRSGRFPEVVKIAIMYDKDREAQYLDTPSNRFKVAGEVVTPELIESVKQELSGK